VSRFATTVSFALLCAWLFFAPAGRVHGSDKIPSAPVREDDADALLERLRMENPGEAAKVQQLLQSDRASALRFLRNRFGDRGKDSPSATSPKSKPPVKTPAITADKQPSNAATLPVRLEPFEKLETLVVGEFSVDLCRRADGAFGLGEIRQGSRPIRRADFLATWTVDGRAPRFEKRDHLTITLRDPAATLTFTPERREVADTSFAGFSLRFAANGASIVENASWELGGDTAGLSYFDGYRGWHAPPQWHAASAVTETNPKLSPSLLHGTGFQFLHGDIGALVHFHTSPGDRLRNVSRGRTRRFIFTAAGDSRINLWTRAFELTQSELRQTFGVPAPGRDIWLRWPPFSRNGFRETASQCASLTARDGFTGACIDVIWNNADFHGGKKNMNVWDYSICEGYGGADGLKALMAECKTHSLLVNAWAPAGHLTAASPVWQEHPEWILQSAQGGPYKNPSGLLHGDLSTPFRDYFSGHLARAVREFGLDGLWMDTHLPYAQQWQKPDHAAKLAAVYLDLIRAGARQFMVEGDASGIGSYAVAMGNNWSKSGADQLDPDLWYGSSLQAGVMEPRFYRDHFRRCAAAGAALIVDWDFLHSPKLTGPEYDAARAEIRQVLADYRRVKDQMGHRFVHADGNGYTWTNDLDRTKIVWLLKPSRLPDGRQGEAGKVYVVPPKS
jgi:hypothetical protein